MTAEERAKELLAIGRRLMEMMAEGEQIDINMEVPGIIRPGMPPLIQRITVMRSLGVFTVTARRTTL